MRRINPVSPIDPTEFWPTKSIWKVRAKIWKNSFVKFLLSFQRTFRSFQFPGKSVKIFLRFCISWEKCTTTKIKSETDYFIACILFLFVYLWSFAITKKVNIFTIHKGQINSYTSMIITYNWNKTIPNNNGIMIKFISTPLLTVGFHLMI